MTRAQNRLEAVRAFAEARAKRALVADLVEREQLCETFVARALAAVHGLALVAHEIQSPIAMCLGLDDQGEVVLRPIGGAP